MKKCVIQMSQADVFDEGGLWFLYYGQNIYVESNIHLMGMHWQMID